MTNFKIEFWSFKFSINNADQHFRNFSNVSHFLIVTNIDAIFKVHYAFLIDSVYQMTSVVHSISR